MDNQRGVTLIEILVAITIIAVVSIPVFMLVNTMLNVYQDTKIRNQLQIEANFITQYMSEKVRDGAIINRTENGWELKKEQKNRSNSIIFMIYNDSSKKVYFQDSTTELTSNVVEFKVGNDLNDGTDKNRINVELTLEDKGITFKLNTFIYADPYSRFSI